MTKPRLLIGFGVMALGLAGGALPPAGAAEEMPCTQEIQTWCADVQPGGGRLLACLKAHEATLSPACMQRMQDFATTLSGPLGVCRDDWVAYCYHPRGAQGETALQCLQANQAQVSAGCHKALEGVGGKRPGSREGMP